VRRLTRLLADVQKVAEWFEIERIHERQLLAPFRVSLGPHRDGA
jgi:hypothetical protein